MRVKKEENNAGHGPRLCEALNLYDMISIIFSVITKLLFIDSYARLTVANSRVITIFRYPGIEVESIDWFRLVFQKIVKCGFD